MDRFDAALLNLVQVDNKLTADKLSDKIGLSPSACQRRLKMLRSTGVIEKDISVVSPAAVGRHMMMVVLITLEREQPDLIDTFKRAMLQTPEVMQCYYVTGSSDFVLIVATRDMSHYEAFSRRFFHENPNIRRFDTSVVMDRVKTGLFVPVEADEE